MKTCSTCEFMKVNELGGGAVASCEGEGLMKGMIVPHKYDGEESPNKLTFWRIPINYSRDDVDKSEFSIPIKQWETITIN